MRRRSNLIITPALIPLIALGVCSVSHAQPKWFVYSPPDKSFSVELPWKPHYEHRNYSDFAGNMRGRMERFKGTNYLNYYYLQMYENETSTDFYISVYDVARKRSDKEFDDEVDSMISPPKQAEDKDWHLVKDEAVTVNGLHGREYVYERGKLSGRMLIVNAGHFIYVLHYHTEDKKGVARPSVERVFNTFQPTP
jgi:hypothetical protein